MFYTLCHKKPRWHFTTTKGCCPDSLGSRDSPGTEAQHFKQQLESVSAVPILPTMHHLCTGILQLSTQLLFSLLRLSKGEMTKKTLVVYDKKCLPAGEMASFHQEALDCGNVCWQPLWTDFTLVSYTDTCGSSSFKFLVIISFNYSMLYFST